MRRRNWWLICVILASLLAGGGEFLREGRAQGAAAEERATEVVEEGAAEGVEEGATEVVEEGATEGVEEDGWGRWRTKEESYAGKVVVIPVGEKDLIVESRFEFMQRILKKAEEDRATAVILDMNTPGGLAWQSGQLIMNYLPDLTIPTYTYVNPNAASAGAIIAVGTDTIYMAPTSAIGAALAVTSMGGELGETMEKKMDSYLRAQVRSVAKTKGHNPDVAEAFVDDDVEVALAVGEAEKDKYPMGMKVISKKGEVLSLDHEEATEIINGKPVLAKGIAKDLEDLVAQEGLEGEILVAKPLGFESFALWVTRFSVLLLALGIAGGYMEMQAPGFGIPGAISLVCFATFFFGHFLAGKLAGFEVVAIFVLGLVLIGVEIFLFPGTLIFGIAGVIMMLGALLYTMAGASPVEGGSFSFNLEGFGDAFMNLALGMGGAVILVALMMRFLPETKAMSWLILKTAVPEGPSLDDDAGRGESGSGGVGHEGERGDGFVGLTGVALTALRPAGKGRFGERTLDIVSDGEFLDAGAAVKIVAREGSRIVVVAV